MTRNSILYPKLSHDSECIIGSSCNTQTNHSKERGGADKGEDAWPLLNFIKWGWEWLAKDNELHPLQLLEHSVSTSNTTKRETNTPLVQKAMVGKVGVVNGLQAHKQGWQGVIPSSPTLGKKVFSLLNFSRLKYAQRLKHTLSNANRQQQKIKQTKVER